MNALLEHRGSFSGTKDLVQVVAPHTQELGSWSFEFLVQSSGDARH